MQTDDQKQQFIIKKIFHLLETIFDETALTTATDKPKRN